MPHSSPILWYSQTYLLKIRFVENLQSEFFFLQKNFFYKKILLTQELMYFTIYKALCPQFSVFIRSYLELLWQWRIAIFVQTPPPRVPQKTAIIQ